MTLSCRCGSRRPPRRWPRARWRLGAAAMAELLRSGGRDRVGHDLVLHGMREGHRRRRTCSRDGSTNMSAAVAPSDGRGWADGQFQPATPVAELTQHQSPNSLRDGGRRRSCNCDRWAPPVPNEIRPGTRSEPAGQPVCAVRKVPIRGQLNERGPSGVSGIRR